MSESLDLLAHSATATKEYACRRRARTIAPFVVATRGDDPLALVTIKRHDPQVILRAAGVCANGYDADLIGLVFETWHAFVGGNPITGQPWKSGEMQLVAEQHDGIGQGIVSEAVCCMAANRAGDVGVRYLPFRMVGDRHVSWSDQTDDKESVGPFIDFLSNLMLRPSASQYLPNTFPLDRDERDLATSEYLYAQGHAPILYAKGANSPLLKKIKEVRYVIRPQD